MLRKLPPTCWAWLDGGPVTIQRGAAEPEPQTVTIEQVSWRNHTLGVTAQQVQAMICGLIFGWEHSSADPDAHCSEPIPLRTFTVAIPLAATITVEAYSNEDAIEQAVSKLTVPEGITIDGRPLITRKH